MQWQGGREDILSILWRHITHIPGKHLLHFKTLNPGWRAALTKGCWLLLALSPQSCPAKKKKRGRRSCYGGESERILQLNRTSPPCPFYSGDRRQVMLWYVLYKYLWQQAGFGNSALLVFVGSNCLVFRIPPVLLLNTEDKCLYAKWIFYLQTFYFSALLACGQCLLLTWSTSISLTCHFCLKEGLQRFCTGKDLFWCFLQ